MTTMGAATEEEEAQLSPIPNRANGICVTTASVPGVTFDWPLDAWHPIIAIHV